MSTQCYAMVRGSAIRVTGLDARGYLPEEIPFAASRAVARITINEVAEGGDNELMRSDEGEPRLIHIRPQQTTKLTCDIDFVRTDPGLLSLVSGAPVVTNASGDVVGFDAQTRVKAASFGLEVWSRLDQSACNNIYPPGSFGVGPFGAGGFGIALDAEVGRKWGYTLFPFLKGGILSGFRFENGLVSFGLRGAQIRRGAKWGDGPYELMGPGKRLFVPVEYSTNFRQIIMAAQPPEPTCGVQTFVDVSA